MIGPSGRLNVVQLHPAWEAEFVAAEDSAQRAHSGVPVADLTRKLVAKVRTQIAGIDPREDPVIAAPDHRRRQLRDILSAHGLPVPVLGLADIDPSADINLIGTIEAA